MEDRRPIEGLAPAAVLLACAVLATQVRMDGRWSTGVLLAVGAVPAAALLVAAVRAPRGSASAAVLLFSGLACALAAAVQLGEAVGDDASLPVAGGVYAVVVLGAWRATGNAYALLLAVVSAVGAVVGLVSVLADQEDDVVLAALAVLAVGLLAGAFGVRGRVATMLASAAGLTLIGLGQGAGGFLLLFGGDETKWGWELVQLAGGLALVAFAWLRADRGVGVLAFFVLAQLALAAGAYETGDFEFDENGEPVEEGGEQTLLGWPLALLLGAAAAAVAGLLHARRPR